MMVTIGKKGIRCEEDGEELSAKEGLKKLMNYRHIPPVIGEYAYAEWLERFGGNVHERRVIEEPRK